MKHKTAMMLLIDKLTRMPESHIKNYLALTQNYLIEKEKEQILKAYVTGRSDRVKRDSPARYYHGTYKQD